MGKEAAIKKAIREIVGAVAGFPIRGEVTAVDGQTCSVKLVRGLTVSDVRLKVLINDNDDYLLSTPKIGTSVLMLSGDGSLNDLTVIKADQVEKMEMSHGGLVILFDGSDGKVSIKNSEVNLKDVFDDLKTIINNLKVSTSTGPSGTPLPPTITALGNWEVKYNKLLK